MVLPLKRRSIRSHQRHSNVNNDACLASLGVELNTAPANFMCAAMDDELHCRSQHGCVMACLDAADFLS